MTVSEKLSGMPEFLRRGIWRVRTEDLKGFSRAWVRSLRIILIAQKEFIKDECSSKASSLTFFSLLSIVPILALGFAIAKGFGLQSHLEKLVFEQFAGHEDVVMQVVFFSRNLMERTSGGVIAGIGAVFLIWSVFKILNIIEQAFNSIWEIPESRTWGRKLSDYLSIMLISPVLLVMSSSATLLISTQIQQLGQTFSFLGMLSPAIGMLLKVLPYVLIWLLLTFLYVFLPNVKVSMLSGLLGGITAGTAFVLVQWAYIRFQVGVAGYNAIYGSFAALPLFLIWMNLSWQIVLAGFELT
ncbi:YihY/virulence factor BrkB family protein, partial [bacterium]|nr:YihY/virulence factor BrkB family protein [bacterium]